MNSLLILSADAAKYTSLISAADLQRLEIVTAIDSRSAEALVKRCNIILGEPILVSEVLASAGNLEWVQSTWAGVDSLCRNGLRRDYLLTGVKDVFGAAISEYVISYIYALERQFFTMHSNQVKKCWKPLSYRPSQKINLGIIGLGSIGRHLAGVASRFGMRVTGLNRSGSPCDDVEAVYTADDLDEFLGQLDYVVVTLPDTPQTRHFINADALRMMKSTAVLINVGRGGNVSESDLVTALKTEVIGGAVLDVFESEPLDQSSPLWSLPNVYITPHHSAISFPESIARIFIGNYQRYMRKELLKHIIDFESGY